MRAPFIAAPQKRAMACSSAVDIVAAHVHGVAEGHACSTPGCPCKASARAPAESGPLTDQVVKAGCVDDIGHGPPDEEVAVDDEREPVASLGFVHVVGGDQERDALRASRWISSQNSRRALGSTPAGRLVEEEQLGLVDHARGQRQPLLPAARQLPGQLPASGARGPGASGSCRTASRRFGHGIHAGDEVEVFRMLRSS